MAADIPTLEDIKTELAARIDRAREDIKDSRRIDPNSYGAGYDDGVFAALQSFRNFILGTEE